MVSCVRFSPPPRTAQFFLLKTLSDASHKRLTKKKEDDAYESFSSVHISLSGLLNFVDGLWSFCGEEKIIISTTNHKEKLDPALLRPGRMDVHILIMDNCMLGRYIPFINVSSIYYK
ncbi:hypothetical protein F2Q70_00027656 [Brassica cretica]|uniref:ATPase AAA-type core domain-containing protein n=1 Tax=Brassica cretica TaxID=69181 RepID=A0A8S9LCZ5_BRACR|nr:hypothetical protein F2Q70_00027656 [Brassica cretica]